MTNSTPARYQVQSKYSPETGRDMYWVLDTRKSVRVGNSTVQGGRAVRRAAALEADWCSAVARLGWDLLPPSTDDGRRSAQPTQARYDETKGKIMATLPCSGIAGDYGRCSAAPSFRVYGRDSHDGALSCGRHLAQVVKFEAQGREVRVIAYENPLKPR